jgi:tetratricopeptide (TPR) repeat protein
LDAGEKFWDDAWQINLAALRQPEREHSSAWSRFSGKLSRALALQPQTDQQRRLPAEWYSISLDRWGVELQRSGRLPAAQQRFEQALALSTNNYSAAINLECNTNLQAGRPLNLTGLEDLSARFKDLPHLTQFIDRGGPIDQPAVCFLLGRYCQASGWPRQAVQQLERARTLAPTALPPDFALGEIYLRYHDYEKVFASVKRLRAALAVLPADQSGPAVTGVDLLEAEAWLAQTNLAQARRCLKAIVQQHPQDPSAARLVVNTYMNFGDYPDALELLQRRLAREPGDVELLNNEAGILLHLDQASNAVAILNRLLLITNAPAVRLNLALAYFQNQDLPAAEAEYQQLEADPPDVFLVHFGLANIAERRHDTNLAIRHLEICLTNAPTGSLRWQESRAHLDALKSAVPGKNLSAAGP